MNINILLDKLPQYTSEGLKIRTNFKESIKSDIKLGIERLQSLNSRNIFKNNNVEENTGKVL